MDVNVEILHECGEFAAGTVHRLEAKRAQKIIRTGYARIVETGDAGAGETAVKPKGVTRTVRGERRG